MVDPRVNAPELWDGPRGDAFDLLGFGDIGHDMNPATTMASDVCDGPFKVVVVPCDHNDAGAALRRLLSRAGARIAFTRHDAIRSGVDSSFSSERGTARRARHLQRM
jgi:hypothetical protein